MPRSARHDTQRRSEHGTNHRLATITHLQSRPARRGGRWRLRLHAICAMTGNRREPYVCYGAVGLQSWAVVVNQQEENDEFRPACASDPADP